MPPSNYRAGLHQVRRRDLVSRLRRDQTDAERTMWQRLRAGQLGGFKFRRQHEFGGFILDFYCPTARLAIELDGSQHLTDDGLAKDSERTQYLAASGIRVLRFLNTEVFTETDSVLEAILRVLRERC